MSELAQLDEAFGALRADLMHDEGPRISTMRNYRFALLRYAPKLEHACRKRVQDLTVELEERGGWVVFSIDLHQLMMDRIRAEGPEFVARMIDRERRLHGRDSGRALNDLKARLHPLIEGEAGLAADCVRIIEEKVEAHPDAQERMLCLVGRAGALYPFYRTSSLLRHVAGKTHNVPVVLLYPGTRAGQTGLSFMGQVEPDHDYRPRIYP